MSAIGITQLPYGSGSQPFFYAIQILVLWIVKKVIEIFFFLIVGKTKWGTKWGVLPRFWGKMVSKSILRLSMYSEKY